MSNKELSKEALQHVVTIPSYLRGKGTARGAKALKFLKIAESLRIMAREQGLAYDKEEFKREFGDIQSARTSIRMHLQNLDTSLALRMVEDEGKILIFANTRQGNQ